MIKTYVCATGEQIIHARLPNQSIRQAAKSEWREWVSGNTQTRLQPAEKSSYAYWMSTETYFPLIQRLVLIVLKAVPSEASCERYFSKQKLVHTPVRNRLTAEMVEAECLIRCIPPRNSKAEPLEGTLPRLWDHLEAIPMEMATYFLGIMVSKARFDLVTVGCEVTIENVRPNGRCKTGWKVAKVLTQGGLRLEGGARDQQLSIAKVRYDAWSVTLKK